MADIHIRVSRHSAFYTPLIMTIAGGFLRDEGLSAEYSVQAGERTVIGGIASGEVQVGQSAVRNYWGALESGKGLEVVHFAQINERDGFFIAARKPDTDFAWSRLEGRSMLVDHGAQPLAMFRYACLRKGLDFDRIEAIDAGGPDAIEAAFRQGSGEFVHLQGPAPQQLEKEGVGHIVASVGEAIGPVAFSSLCAHRDWLKSDAARAFMRAYRAAKAHVIGTDATAIARAEKGFFPEIDETVLAATIRAYQELGCWGPEVAISREGYERALDVFDHAGQIERRHPYEDAVVPPPDAA